MDGQTSGTKKKRRLPAEAFASGIAVLILIFVALLARAANTRRIVIKNNTGQEIESIRLYFENMEENFYFLSEDLANTQIAAGANYYGKFDV